MRKVNDSGSHTHTHTPNDDNSNFDFQKILFLSELAVIERTEQNRKYIN